MSFSANVKEELSKINIFSNEDIVKAELYGYLLTVDMQGISHTSNILIP